MTLVHPVGASQGASRGALAPNASMQLKVKEGNVEVIAIGAKERVNDKESEVKSASQVVELKAPVELVFHDSTQSIVERRCRRVYDSLTIEHGNAFGRIFDQRSGPCDGHDAFSNRLYLEHEHVLTARDFLLCVFHFQRLEAHGRDLK